MKYGLLLLILSLFNCTNNKVHKTKIEAIGFVFNGERVKLYENHFMNTQKITVVFTRINESIYETAIKDGKFIFYKLKLDKKSLTYFLEGFSENSTKNLDIQIKQKRSSNAVCGLIDGYFINENKNKFCLLGSSKLADLITINFKNKRIEIKNNKTTKRLEDIYYKINSLSKDYFFSNKYHYKEVRVTEDLDFPEPNK